MDAGGHFSQPCGERIGPSVSTPGEWLLQDSGHCVPGGYVEEQVNWMSYSSGALAALSTVAGDRG